jgi:hypothetical protein
MRTTTLTRLGIASVGIAALVPAMLTSPAQAKAVRHFDNCTAMHKVYPHGVGRIGAHDHTSGTPVTNFARKPAVYRANTGLDRDKDHIACESA